MENAEERIGKFSASRISELLAQGNGKTAINYCLDLAMETIGLRSEFDTPAMKHGVISQFDAFQFMVKPRFKEAIWFDEYVPINDLCGASPDIKIDDKTPMDIKCPFYVDTFIDQINSVPTKYYKQVQMQIMALGGDEGYLGFYLTKPMQWGEETVIEYPFPLEDRTAIFNFKRDEEVIDSINKAVEVYEPKKQLLVEMLKKATLMDEVEFYYLQLKGGNKLRPLSYASNLLGVNEFIRRGDKFYYRVK